MLIIICMKEKFGTVWKHTLMCWENRGKGCVTFEAKRILEIMTA